MALRTQTPTAPNEWLYQDRGEDRYFTTFVHLGKEEPMWAECTNEDKAAYEDEWNATHPEESGTPDSEEPTADPVAADTTEVPTETNEEDEP